MKKIYPLTLTAVLIFALYQVGEINQMKTQAELSSARLSQIEQEQSEINSKLDSLSDELQQAQTAIEQSKVDLSYKREIPLSDDLQRFTYDLCNQYGVDYDLVLSIMREESQYIAGAISDNGEDYGLMQINSSNLDWLSSKYNLKDMLNPQDNITAGIIILDMLQDQYDTVEGVLLGYNMKPKTARLYYEQGRTTEYVTKVLGGN